MEQLLAILLAGCTIGFVVHGEFLPDVAATVEEELGPPEPSKEYNNKCMATWDEEGIFWFWLVRIMYQEPKTTVRETLRRDIGTGSMITTRHVLTACHPVWTVGVGQGTPNNVHVFSFVIQLSDHEADVVDRVNPWASKEDGCILEWYTAIKGYYPKGRCVQNGNVPFQDLNDNFLILALLQELTFPDWNQWVMMPFDRTLRGPLQTLKWFQHNRKARCQIPRWKVTNQIIILPPAGIQQTGYTYRAMEWAQECSPLLCRDFCASKQSSVQQDCQKNCMRREAPRWRGKIFCLKRMLEGKQSTDKNDKFYHSYDSENVDKDFVQEGRKDLPPTKSTSEACKKSTGYASSLYGAPVVCMDDVVAIVTMCRPEYLAATPIASIRHHIFKLWPEEFSRVQLYLDGSNDTLAATTPHKQAEPLEVVEIVPLQP